MSDVQDPIAYQEQITFLRDSIMSLATEAIAVFEQDFPQFFHREARRRFLESPDFARKISDEDLAALKKALTETGKSATKRVIETLRAPELWLAGTAVDEPDPKRFDSNATLWAAVEAISKEVESLLESFGFPTLPGGGYGVAYAEPKRFVSGHYLPSTAEKYWRRVAEMRELEATLEELAGERERSELLARWSKF